MQKCCRCQTALREGTYKGVPLARCPGCEGVLVQVRNNVPFLDALSNDIADEVGVHDEIEPHEGADKVAACPACSQPMERFGYMGTNRVYLDRCGPCLLLWVDGDEVVTLAMLYARTKARSIERTVRFHERAKALDRSTHAVIMARMMDHGFHML